MPIFRSSSLLLPRRALHTISKTQRASSFVSQRPAYYFLRTMATTRGFEIKPVKFGDSGNLPGLETGDKSSKSGIIVLQEWWGITEEVKAQAKHIAAQGYQILIPDLYKGKLGVDAEEASHLMTNLDFSAATEEIKQAAKYLKSQGAEKVGVIGFCMGGALSLCGVQHSPDINAGVTFYGVPGEGVCQPEKIKKPVQGHFGKLDENAGFSDVAAAKKLEDNLSKGGSEHAVFLYDNVGHAFMNEHADKPQLTPDKTAETGFPPTIPEHRELAWSRVFEFFGKHLK